jgi:hypothetical protein
LGIFNRVGGRVGLVGVDSQPVPEVGHENTTMSILKSSNPPITAGTEPDAATLTPEQAVEQLRAMQSQIPAFAQLPNDREMRLIRRRASVNVEFAREAFNAVGASEAVQQAIGNSPEELHAAEDEVGRWTAVEAELRATLRGVTAANMLRRERIGLAALTVLNVSRDLVRQEEHAALWPHVEAMSRIPKYNRQRKTNPAKPPNPAKTA